MIYYRSTGAISLSKRRKRRSFGQKSRSLNKKMGHDIAILASYWEEFFMSKSPRTLTRGALIAATYAALTLFLPIPPYGGIQLRVAEAMTVLPFFLPEAIPGLTVGCFIANYIGSPFALDCIFGTLATFLAAVWTSRCRSARWAWLPPVVCNSVIIGAEIAWMSAGEGAAFGLLFVTNALTIGVGEFVSCFFLGGLLLRTMEKYKNRY